VALALAVPSGRVSSQENLENPDNQAQLYRYAVDGPKAAIRTGETFDLRVRLTGKAEQDAIDVMLPEFPGGVSFVGSPTVVVRDPGPAEIRMTLRGSQPGRYVIEGITITVASDTREVEPILLSVEQRDGVVPFRARWRVLAEGITQSQTVPVLLELVGAADYLFPEDIAYRAPETGLFEEVAGLGAVESRTIGEETLYNIPVATFLFTPAGSGAITIPAATVSASGISAAAPAQTVETVPLPTAAAASNAVGTYSITHSVTPLEIEPGGILTVELTLDGVGNLPVADFPAITVEGLVETERSETGHVLPDRDELKGYRGSRTRVITYEAEQGSTEAEVIVGAYTYYDPYRRETARIASSYYEVDVIGEGALGSDETSIPELPLLSVADLSGPWWYRLKQTTWIYYLFILGPVLFGITALWSVRRKAKREPRRRGPGMLVGLVPILLGAALFPPVNWERLENARRLIDENRPAVAAVLYDLEIDQNDWHGGLHYNRGVLSLRLDRPVLAMYHLRRAVRLAPERRDFRTALAAAETWFGLEEQLPMPRYIRPDIFIVGLIVLWTVFWVMLFFRKRLRTTLSLVAIGMVMVVLVGGAVWSWNLDRQRDGVITEVVHLRRIPDAGAVPWVRLGAAHAVRIELEYEDFYLVRTQTGINGWVPRNTVRTQKE